MDEFATGQSGMARVLVTAGLSATGPPCRTVSEIGRVYAPGADAAAPDPSDPRETPRSWLVTPRRSVSGTRR